MIIPHYEHRQIKILLVDDERNEARLIRKALESIDCSAEVESVDCGEECIKYLRRFEPYSNATTPDLILLDLYLPLFDGRDIMREILRDENLRALPIVVFTSSADPKDVMDMYDLRCSGYIIKPLEMEELSRMMKVICEYWFNVAMLPTRIRLPLGFYLKSWKKSG